MTLDRNLTDNQIIELDEIIESMDLPEVGTSDFHHYAAVHFATYLYRPDGPVETTAADYAFYMEI